MTIQTYKGDNNQELVSKADYDKLAAEGAALKSGPQGFFSYGSDSGYAEFSTAKEAIESAEYEIDYYRGSACDGWSDEVDQVCWGIIMQRSTMTDLRSETGDDGVKKEICDYSLLPPIEIPATDTAIDDFKAQGADMVLPALVTSDDDDFADAPAICANVAANLRAGVKP